MLFSTLLTVLLPLLPADTVAKDTATKRFNLLLVPAIYYTPETRLAFGFGLTATFRFRRDSLVRAGSPIRPSGAGPAEVVSGSVEPGPSSVSTPARPSQISLGAAYTQNKQLLFFVPFQVFYDHDNYYLNGEIGYYRYSYYFYGVGQREVPRELYGVNFINTKINAFRRIATLPSSGKLYGGIRHQYEDFGVTTVAPEGLLAVGTVPGASGSRRSAYGLGLFYDSRDQVFFPTKGVIIDLTYLRNRWTASERQTDAPTQYDRYGVEASSYHALAGPKLILAVNYVASYTSGVAPFNDLSKLGSARRMRGYYEGRYRDRNLALLQTEARFVIYRRLGGVAFGAVGLLGDNQTLLRTNDPKLAYGGGLRFTVNRADHINIRIDYGISRDSGGLYVTIGEAF